MFCRPKFRGEVEMPVLLGNDDPAHSVTILDQVRVGQEEKRCFFYWSTLKNDEVSDYT